MIILGQIESYVFRPIYLALYVQTWHIQTSFYTLRKCYALSLDGHSRLCRSVSLTRYLARGACYTKEMCWLRSTWQKSKANVLKLLYVRDTKAWMRRWKHAFRLPRQYSRCQRLCSINFIRLHVLLVDLVPRVPIQQCSKFRCDCCTAQSAPSFV